MEYQKLVDGIKNFNTVLNQSKGELDEESLSRLNTINGNLQHILLKLPNTDTTTTFSPEAQSLIEMGRLLTKKLEEFAKRHNLTIKN